MFIELAKQRRTIYQFSATPVMLHQLECCLEAAIWAPNHGLTEPWRFFVIGPKTREALRLIYASSRAAKRAEVDTVEYDAIYQKALAKFDAIPQVVLVAQKRCEDAVVSKEDYAACACAIQNFQLAAWEQGIGVQWSTGPIIKAIETYQALGVSVDDVEWIGILYMGYADCIPNQRRQPLSEVVRFCP
ncbi:MAG: nitroreductase [Thiomicrospira sp.]